jgi:hypothetical protein
MDTKRSSQKAKHMQNDYVFSEFEKSTESSEGESKKRKRIRAKISNDEVKRRKNEHRRIKELAKTDEEKAQARERRREKRFAKSKQEKRTLQDNERDRQRRCRTNKSDDENDQIRAQDRKRKLKCTRESSSASESSIQCDARKYSEELKAKVEFGLCAVCAYEGPMIEMHNRETLDEFLELSQIAEEFYEWMGALETGSKYDVEYRKAVLEEMADGLLIGVSNVCNECAKFLKNRTKKKKNSEDRPNIPPHALVRGLFPGAIPTELHGLTPVELSMISIYSNTTKIALNCQGHFHAKPTLYTIVNEDLVNVCEILPRIPAHSEFAILRHRGADFIHEFKYRPAKVRQALNWLRTHNHLYHPEKIGVDDSLLDLSISEVDLIQPYFDVDDEEAEAIAHVQSRSTPSTNSGLNVLLRN